MKNIRNHKISSAIAIALGAFYLILCSILLITQYKPENIDNTLFGLCLGVGYLGFGIILRYSIEHFTKIACLISLIILTLAVLLPTIFQPGEIVISFFTVIVLFLLFLLAAELSFLKTEPK